MAVIEIKKNGENKKVPVPETELLVLQALSSFEKATVQKIKEKLAESNKEISEASLYSLLNRLEQRGLVKYKFEKVAPELVSITRKFYRKNFDEMTIIFSETQSTP
jgi:DNA-binding PadR family transcriptional regulator